jgi:hypothetical protein
LKCPPAFSCEAAVSGREGHKEEANVAVNGNSEFFAARVWISRPNRRKLKSYLRGPPPLVR